MKIRLLTRADVKKAVSMAEAIDLVKGAFAQLSAGHAQVPLRAQLWFPQHNAVTLVMPAYLQDSAALGVKVVSVFPANPELGLPTTHALVILVDADTGQPIAAMDGTYLTALRTGAASGAATDLLARHKVQHLAILGAGGQGRTQLQGVCQVRDIRHVRVYDAIRQRAEAFAEEMGALGGRVPTDIAVVGSAREAVARADIICTATTSKVPVFRDADLKAGVHINGIGSYSPEMQEMDEATVARAKIVVDSRAAALAEAGDLVIPLRKGIIAEANIHAELGEIVMGLKAGRENDDEITVFKAVGNAVQDMSVAHRVLQRSAQLGLGTEVDL
jgi:alanine dehydrogenase